MAKDEQGAVHVGTSGGAGGGEPEGGRDPEAAREFIERSGRDRPLDTEKIGTHDSDAGASLGADEAGSDEPRRA